MVAFLIRWLVTTVAVLVAAHIVPGVDYHGNYVALAVTALVLGILNAFLRPLLLILTLPLNILTLGILTLFINAFLFWLAGRMVDGFTVERFFWSAVFGALIVSIVSFFLNSIFWRQGRVQFHGGRSSPQPPKRDDNVIDV